LLIVVGATTLLFAPEDRTLTIRPTVDFGQQND